MGNHGWESLSAKHSGFLLIAFTTFHDRTVSRIALDRSLNYPYIASLIMSFDVVPSHAEPYDFSMGPQATNRAMAFYAAPTVTPEEKNNDWAPFVVVVLCMSFLLSSSP
jgi:hypothetical protein